MFSSTMIPPFSPVLLGGLAARGLSPKILQPALRHAMKTIFQRHPDLFERLSHMGAPVYLIDPIDLPLAFVLYADVHNPEIEAVRSAEGVNACATIRGPLLSLLRLLEGRIDGDALFFSRELVIEGDTEAVLALRNTVDGVEVDVMEEILTAFSANLPRPLSAPMSAPVRLVARLGQGLFARAADDLSILHTALTAPLQRRVDAQAAQLEALKGAPARAPSKPRAKANQRTLREGREGSQA